MEPPIRMRCHQAEQPEHEEHGGVRTRTVHTPRYLVTRIPARAAHGTGPLSNYYFVGPARLRHMKHAASLVLASKASWSV